jgi:RNA polymerase sigma-70 factor (sigma-E family)
VTPSGIGDRIADALRAACHPQPLVGASVGDVQTAAWTLMANVVVPDANPAVVAPAVTAADVDRLVVELFEREGRSLVRLTRLFVDDRNAAEDLVQEAFIRLARSADRIKDERKAAAYLRSIVLNLARDHNRRGLVSLRHHLPFDDFRASTEDEIGLRDDQRVVIEALRDLPHRQRDCLVLRYYQELGVDDIAATLGISRNSVKTHLKRGLAAMQTRVPQLEGGGRG